MIYEIRDYHVEPAVLGRYQTWASEHALPYIRMRLDLVGFWICAAAPAQVTGEALDAIGPANVTWVIRWQDMDTRNRIMAEVFGPGASEWARIATHHPGREHYRRIAGRFGTAL